MLYSSFSNSIRDEIVIKVQMNTTENTTRFFLGRKNKWYFWRYSSTAQQEIHDERSKELETNTTFILCGVIAPTCLQPLLRCVFQAENALELFRVVNSSHDEFDSAVNCCFKQLLSRPAQQRSTTSHTTPLHAGIMATKLGFAKDAKTLHGHAAMMRDTGKLIAGVVHKIQHVDGLAAAVIKRLKVAADAAESSAAGVEETARTVAPNSQYATQREAAEEKRAARKVPPALRPKSENVNRTADVAAERRIKKRMSQGLGGKENSGPASSSAAKRSKQTDSPSANWPWSEAPSSSTPRPEPAAADDGLNTYNKGEKVEYLDKDTTWVLAVVAQVDCDDGLIPYYSVRFADGREKQTQADRLR